MRALWSDKQNCSHNLSQKFERFRCFSDSNTMISLSFLVVISLSWDQHKNKEWPRYCQKVCWTKPVRIGQGDHFGPNPNDLFLNCILAFTGQTWTILALFCAPKGRRRRRAEKRSFSSVLRANHKGEERKRTLQKQPFGRPFLRMTPSPLLFWRAQIFGLKRSIWSFWVRQSLP